MCSDKKMPATGGIVKGPKKVAKKPTVTCPVPLVHGKDAQVKVVKKYETLPSVTDEPRSPGKVILKRFLGDGKDGGSSPKKVKATATSSK